MRDGITKPEKFLCQFPPWHPQPVVRDDPEITSRQVAITLIWYEHDPHPHPVDRLIFEIILIADRVADLHYDRYDHFIFCTTFYDGFFREGVYGGHMLCGVSDPVNTKHLYNICTMLDQRRAR